MVPGRFVISPRGLLSFGIEADFSLRGLKDLVITLSKNSYLLYVIRVCLYDLLKEDPFNVLNNITLYSSIVKAVFKIIRCQVLTFDIRIN